MDRKRPASMTSFFIAILALGTLTCPPLTGVSLPASQGHTFYTQTSWYSNVETHNRRCADGKYHDLTKELVCASWDYRIGQRLLVTRIGGKNVEVVVVDRGPAKRLCKIGRRVDLSRAAFQRIARLESGVANIKVEVIK